jgi:hypothetical protein
VSRTRPPLRSKKLLWSSLFAVAIVAAGFLIMAVGNAFIIVAFAGMACLVGYTITLGNYRQEKWPFLTTLVLGFATFFPAHVGSHSVWLSAFGETVHCKVISIVEVPHRTSPNTFKNKLQCGERQLDYTPTSYHSAQKPGTEMDLVVDKMGVVPNLEPDKVGLGYNLLFVLAVLMNAAFIFLVAWLPVRERE